MDPGLLTGNERLGGGGVTEATYVTYFVTIPAN